jgi:hypothetical protein
MTQIRGIALSSFNLSKERRGHLSDSKLNSTRRLTESLKKSFQSHSKRAGPSAEGRGNSSPKRLRAGPVEDDVIVIEDSGEVSSPSKSVAQHDSSGHGAKTEIEAAAGDMKTLDPKKVLQLFRLNQKKLA